MLASIFSMLKGLGCLACIIGCIYFCAGCVEGFFKRIGDTFDTRLERLTQERVEHERQEHKLFVALQDKISECERLKEKLKRYEEKENGV